jgi:hypothetical protein
VSRRWKKADLRWQGQVQYRERIARRHSLISSPGPEGTWNLRLFDLETGEQPHYPYAVVELAEPHTLNVRIVLPLPGAVGVVEHSVCLPDFGRARGFNEACKLAFPALQVYDAANRLTGYYNRAGRHRAVGG